MDVKIEKGLKKLLFKDLKTKQLFQFARHGIIDDVCIVTDEDDRPWVTLDGRLATFDQDHYADNPVILLEQVEELKLREVKS